MPDQEPRRWEQQLQNATARAEEDLRRVVDYINNDVVPDIRRNGSHALRTAAAELQKLAERMDDRRTSSSSPPNPASNPDRS